MAVFNPDADTETPEQRKAWLESHGFAAYAEVLTGSDAEMKFDPPIWPQRNPDEIPLAHLSRDELFSLVCRIGQIVLPHNETLRGELPDVTANVLLELVAHAHECGGYFNGYKKELGQ